MFNNVLVIGASGKTGSRVAKRLNNLDVNYVPASRSAAVKFDWDQPKTWRQALHGVDAVYLTYYPDLAVPKAPSDIQSFIRFAEQAGVKHITLLSGRGEPAAQACEDILKQSTLSWTIVRASWFSQNFSEGLFRQFISDRKIALPVSIVREPFIDIDDIADLVVTSLTEPGHSNTLYEATGPELLSFPQVAQRFSAILGVDISFQQISMQAFKTNMENLGVDPGAISMLTYLFSEVLDGRNEYICHGVKEALGKEPRTFNQFIQHNLHAFEVRHDSH